MTPGTLKVLYTLRDAGYEAYMVGGGVRDLIAGAQPKDFDVATSATPEELRRLFRNCRLIGRRFMIAHVRMSGEIIEVTTFRAPISDTHQRDDTGRILADNVYGTLESDAFRRDFTINALYYDIRDYAVLDFADGLADLEGRRLRLIGDPELRYREDPVRMLRAVRIANKLGFGIEPATLEPIPRLAPLLGEIPPARLFDEIIKLLLSPQAEANLDQLRQLGLFGILFPDVETALTEEPAGMELLHQAARNTTARINQQLPVTPAFLYAALLWPPLRMRAAYLRVIEGHPPLVALAQAADEVLARQGLRIAIPKRFALPMREIWMLQSRFEQRQSSARVRRLLAHPRFRAAYDFLLLRAAVGEEPALPELAQWWTDAQQSEELPAVPQGAEEPAEETASAPKKRRRRRGGRHRGGRSEGSGGDG
jgi:poly(A) polymerase